MRRVPQGGPTLFDGDDGDGTGPGAGEVAFRAVDATESSPGPVPPAPPPRRTAYRGEPGYVCDMTPAEAAAALVPIPDRSRWSVRAEGVVEVRGSSALVVWFVTADGDRGQPQRTLRRVEFLKRGVRQ